MSKTQDRILKDRKGYRCEKGCSGITLFRDVLEYEMLELGNMSIPKYVYEFFCTSLSNTTKSSYIRKTGCPDLFKILEGIANGEYEPTNLRNIKSLNTILDFMEIVVRDSSFHSFNGPLHCCWLTSLVACKMYYGSDVSCYALPRRFAIVVDEGAKGILLVAPNVINCSKNLVRGI